MRNLRIALLLALCTVLAFAPPALAQCNIHRGTRVVLYSQTDDPDVLVWDSRFRLRDYHAASFDEAQQLLPHAWLVAPGTRATVETCVSDFVLPRLINAPDNAVGIVINTGPRRNQRGWVLGSDIRPRSPH
ncbi:MAG: hypothetical protein ABI231_06840 [Candidatus Tumulicola sp.]